MIASNDGKNLNTVGVENILLFTVKQGIRKYNVKHFDVRRTFRSYYHKLFNECILKDRAVCIKFLAHIPELLRNSTIYWDNLPICDSMICLGFRYFIGDLMFFVIFAKG